MTHPHFVTAFRHWLHDMGGQAVDALPDGTLLERFVRQRDETAFEMLLHRHGSLVLGTCRRLLRDVHDADDAFQATFLVLACRAAAIHRTESVASYLYATACRIARRLNVQKVRRQALHQKARRRQRESTATDDRETCTALHEELERLPRKYRDALVLCYLQGKTNEQAARELGHPPGSMSRHLNRARELLRQRLLGRGVGVLAAMVGSALAEQAGAAVPPALLRGTMDTVRRHGLAAALLAGSTPPVAVVLARGVLRAAWVTRGTMAAAMLLVGVVLAGGAAALQVPAAKQPSAEAKPPAPAPAATPKEAPRLDLYGDPLPNGALARLGTERLRHPFALRVVFAADGKTLISAGQDQTVRFWDLATGKLKRLQRAPQEQLVVALSADGKTLALTSEEHLHLWDITAAKEIQRIATGKLADNMRLQWVEFSPDGKTLAAGNAEGTVLVWDAASGKERKRFKHPDDRVHNLAFAPDGKVLAAAGNQHLTLWNLASGAEINMKTAARGNSVRLRYSPDGKLLAEGAYGTVRLWDAATGNEEAVLRFDDPDNKRFMDYYAAFAPDGKTLAISLGDCVVLWDRATRKETKRLEVPRSAIWRSSTWLGFSANGERLASATSGKITLWDVAGGKQLQERPGHFVSPESVAISPDGKSVGSASGQDGTVRLWDAHSGKQLHVWTMPYRRINPVLFTPDSAHLIAGGWLGDSRMWEVRSGEERHVFRVPPVPKDGSEMVPVAQLSPDGKQFTALSLLAEGKGGVFKGTRHLTSWDVGSGKQLQRRSLAFNSKILDFVEGLSPDGRFSTSLGSTGLLIFDTVADRPVRTLTENVIAPVAFSPDSKLLAYAGNHSPVAGAERVHVHDLTSGTDVLKLAAGSTWRRAFSPDSRYLLTSSGGDLRLWELATGKEVLRHHVAALVSAPGNPSSVATCLAFAADGRSAAVGMPDTNVLIWDLAPETRRKRKLTADDLDRLWAELAGDDAAKAYRAAGKLIADPERALPLLRERLHPIPEDAPRIRRLIADLDSEQFAVRDAARKELEKMDDAAHAVLRQVLKEVKALETRRRIQSLLSVSWLVREPEKRRQVRAVMVLEQIGDTESRRLLERLASGAGEARQTREARMALKRLTGGRR